MIVCFVKTEEQLKQQFEQIRGSLDERSRREWAASEAMALGYGGIARVHRATGIVPSTIGKGIRELHGRPDGIAESEERRRLRRPGGGRPRKTDESPELIGSLERLVEPVTRGDPMSPLRWTCKSLRQLAAELVTMGFSVSYRTVGRLLKQLKYSLQGNRKTLEGAQHPDRNAQFEYINSQTKQQLTEGSPAVSVDTKKKELVGEYKNGGREYRPQGEPDKVGVHDFIGELGRRIRMVSTTSTTTRLGSALASAATLPSSLWRPFAAGGTRWGSTAIQKRIACSLLPTAVEAMGTELACGSSNCRSLSTSWASR